MFCGSAAAACTPFFSAPVPFTSNSRFPSHSRFSVRMSSSDSHNPNQIIEHIVLFKVKPTAAAAAVDAMIANLNGLISLDPVLHISTGPVSRSHSGSSLTFTHVLHSRYGSKLDLASYSDHPEHVSVVSNHVKPVVDDVMAVDWVADGFECSVALPPGAVLRLTVLKLKEGAGEMGKDEVLGIWRGFKEKFPSIVQLTVGENFSPGRAKGFSICSIWVLKGAKELEAFDFQSAFANEPENKAWKFLDDMLVLDFPAAASVQSANH